MNVKEEIRLTAEHHRQLNREVLRIARGLAVYTNSDFSTFRIQKRLTAETPHRVMELEEILELTLYDRIDTGLEEHLQEWFKQQCEI